MGISNLSLKEILPISLLSTSAVSIRDENKIWVATGMLVHYVESFTDSLVVTDDKNFPIGVIGGYEIIKNVFENPSSEFFEKNVSEIMDVELIHVTQDTKLLDLISKWQETRRAFCIIPNKIHGYSAISGRKLLEVGANCKTSLRVSDLPEKKIVRFSKEDTIGKIIHMMIENRTRKLILGDTTKFISDRLIIQTIAQELNYLRETENFLDLKFAEFFKLDEVKIVSENFNLTDLSKLMFGMLHPYASTKNSVFTPWDVCNALISEEITLANA